MPISLLRRLLYCIFFFFVLLCTPLFALPTSAQSSVVIGEVQWAGSENSSADEWIELWNLGSTPFSLANFHVRGVGSGSDLVFSSQMEIAPQSAFLIANYHALDPKSTLVIEAQVVSTTLSIANENTSIALLDPTGTVIDEVRWDKTALAGSSVIPRSSMVRTVELGKMMTSWQSATTSQNLLLTAHQFGTPGFCESCSLATPVVASNPSATSTATSSEPISEIEPPIPMTETSPPPPINPSPDPLISETPADLSDLLLDAADIDSSTLETEPQKEPAPEVTLENSPEPTFPVTTSTQAVDEDTEEPSFTTSTLQNVASSSSVEFVVLPDDELSATSSVPVAPESSLFPEIPSSTSSSLSVATSTQSPTPESPLIATTTSSVATTNTPSNLPTIAILETNFPTPIFLPQIGSRVYFSEIYPSPSKGPEWIELRLESSMIPSDLVGWSIRNAEKTVLTIGSTTPFTWNDQKRLLLFSLQRNKLPNKGGHLLLVDAIGRMENELIFPSISKDTSWAITQDALWRQTTTATPNAENKLTSIAIPSKANVAPKKSVVKKIVFPSSTEKLPVKNSVPPSSSKKILQTKFSTAIATTVSPIKDSITAIEQDSPIKRSSLPQIKTSSTKKVKTPKKTPSQTKTPKASANPQTIDLKDLGPMHASTRVRLTGTVATLPRLLGNNAFVIQTDDGRGLYVSGNNKQTSPPFRAHISLTGTLSLNDDGLILHMYTNDRWRLLELDRAVQQHIPDLNHASPEDAWSYVQLRGIVHSVSPTRITLLHDEIEISVSVRPLVRYRTERLNKGDEIEVSGILDTRKDVLTLLPRLVEEIRMIKTAPTAQTKTASGTPTPLPWAPIGVAGISIAATQSIRRYWKYRLEQKIRFSKPN